MFKKKDIAIAIALAMTVSQPVLGQGESGEASASSAAAPAASGPAAAAVPAAMQHSSWHNCGRSNSDSSCRWGDWRGCYS